MQMPNTCKRVCQYSTMTHPLVAYLNPNQSIDCYALMTDLGLWHEGWRSLRCWQRLSYNTPLPSRRWR